MAKRFVELLERLNAATLVVDGAPRHVMWSYDPNAAEVERWSAWVRGHDFVPVAHDGETPLLRLVEHFEERAAAVLEARK